MSAADPIIRLDTINKSFGAFRALTNVSLEIAAGEKVVILGPSGSGKSTLLRTINRLESIDSGTIVVDGHNLYAPGEDINRIRMEVGMVFQSFNLFRHKTVLENLTLAPIRLKRLDRARAEAIALALLDKVGMRDRAGHYPIQLSGGQQQRVAIARALLNEPAVILADEPTGQLDSNTGQEIMDLFSSIHQAGTTIILVTHDASVAAHARRRIHIHDGHIVKDTQRPQPEHTEAAPYSALPPPLAGKNNPEPAK